MKEIVETMRHDLSIRMGNPSHSAFSISFTYPDRYKAQAVVFEVVSRFTELNADDLRARGIDMPADNLVRRILEQKLGENLEVLDPASDPQQPIEPLRARWAVIGMGVGLLLGAITLWFRQSRSHTLQTA
jgi:capsular polysaccharide biosynthesis protein